MTYNDWLETVAYDMRSDLLWQLPVYQHSLFLSDLAWFDCSQLAQDRRTVGVSQQLEQRHRQDKQLYRPRLQPMATRALISTTLPLAQAVPPAIGTTAVAIS